MEQSPEADVYPKHFEFIEREQAAIGPHLFKHTSGVLLAGEDLLRAAGHVPGSRRPKGWREGVEGFGRRAEDRKYLRTIKLGDYWFVFRSTTRSHFDYEYLTLAFDEVPLCARTAQEGMRLADHCHPDPGLTTAGLWVPSFRR
jgi:hypothetical protein